MELFPLLRKEKELNKVEANRILEEKKYGLHNLRI
jgi:hypothetical protein